jgi:hypothetical protein
MIVEMRTYTLKPGTVPEYLRRFRAEGVETQTRILGNLVGLYTAETGDANQVVYLWAYDSMEERDRRRAELYNDPHWLAYVPQVRDFLVTQESRILRMADVTPATEKG